MRKTKEIVLVIWWIGLLISGANGIRDLGKEVRAITQPQKAQVSHDIKRKPRREYVTFVCTPDGMLCSQRDGGRP